MIRNTRNNTWAFTLIELMIVIGIITILTSMAFHNLLRAKLSANESFAQATLKTISTALEDYANHNSGYPNNTTILIGSTPPYLSRDFFVGIHTGYTFTAVLNPGMYIVTATPVNENTGKTTYTITTGGVLEAL